MNGDEGDGVREQGTHERNRRILARLFKRAIGAVKILDAYIARHVVGGTLLALAVLVSLSAVITFVDDLGSVGHGRYGIGAAIEFMLLTLPRQAFVLFPIAAVIGALFGLGALSASSELRVIRTAGVSIGRIIVSVLKGALLLVIVAVLIGEVVAPYCERLVQARRSAVIEESPGWGNGFWIREGRSFVNVLRVWPGDRVEGMFIYEFDAEGRLRVATHAERAEYRDGGWALESVRRSEVSAHGVAIRSAENAVWPARFGTDLVELASARLESLSGFALARYIGYLEDNRLDTAVYELALWTKVTYPLATGAMIFLAAPLVLGRLGGAGIGQRILAGCLIAITFHVVNEASGKIGIVYGLSPLLCAFVPTLAFLTAGAWLLRRVR